MLEWRKNSRLVSDWLTVAGAVLFKLPMPIAVNKGSIKKSSVRDNPYRGLLKWSSALYSA
ncbi:hypothetical protein AZH43_04485 [Acinetobacter pragensis]|uniref:Uncharacterized protein n=1 Tax=Acinetobacter pragensis TaxID=1806892 RepID=A0A151XX86_9GAMM|nr:hypothetical protein AZH43_04485 [Acinetobacter pragensis]